MARFDGKRVFVTGGASGIGAATVELFRNEGAQVVATDIVTADGIVTCDVSDGASVRLAMEEAIEQLGYARWGVLPCVADMDGIERDLVYVGKRL